MKNHDNIVYDFIFRGQMGLSEEDQKNARGLRAITNGGNNIERNTEDITAHTNNICNAMEREGCCQPNGKTTCCHNPPVSAEDSVNIDLDNEFSVRKRKGIIKNQNLSDINNKTGRTSRKTYNMPTWLESWESEDVYAALALIGAAVSVAVAYNCYRQLS